MPGTCNRELAISRRQQRIEKEARWESTIGYRILFAQEAEMDAYYRDRKQTSYCLGLQLQKYHRVSFWSDESILEWIWDEGVYICEWVMKHWITHLSGWLVGISIMWFFKVHPWLELSELGPLPPVFVLGAAQGHGTSFYEHLVGGGSWSLSSGRPQYSLLKTVNTHQWARTRLGKWFNW